MEASGPSDQDCIIELINNCHNDPAALQRLAGHVAFFNQANTGEVNYCELLCKKCPFGLMVRSAADGTNIEARAISPEACADGRQSGLSEDWTLLT